MIGFRFSNYTQPNQTPFDKLFDIFKQLITYTSGLPNIRDKVMK